jgi:lipoprotein signal peptidase
VFELIISGSLLFLLDQSTKKFVQTSLLDCSLACGRFLQHPIEVAGLGCALGGAAGNLTDILRQGYVLDFVDLGWWPVFNVADIGIVGGLLAAFWY